MANGGVKRNIPIKMGDFSVLDSEFSNIRERFDNEMRKMEEEMARFRSELMNHESNFFKTSTSHHSQTSETRSSSTTSSSSGTWKDSGTGTGTGTGKRLPTFPDFDKEFQKFSSSVTNSSSSTTDSSRVAPGGGPSTWLEGLNSPLIQEDGGDKKLKLRFDVSLYAPEEIVVKTVDNKLLVHAKHEEKTESKSVYREYNREFLLPKGTNPESIKSSLSKDGVLTVEAPLPALGAAEKLIPIAH